MSKVSTSTRSLLETKSVQGKDFMLYCTKYTKNKAILEGNIFCLRMKRKFTFKIQPSLRFNICFETQFAFVKKKKQAINFNLNRLTITIFNLSSLQNNNKGNKTEFSAIYNT